MKANLEQIRLSQELTQAQLAERLRVNQSRLSKLERGEDMRVSMLRSYIQAMGGHLELRATFPEKEDFEIVGLDESGTVTDLKDLMYKKCRLQPMPPEHEYNEFFIKSVDDNLVTFSKTSNEQRLVVPVRRVEEVLQAGPGELPTVLLKGSLNWSGQKRLWEFRP